MSGARTAGAASALRHLLDTLDPQAPLAQRHLWLIALLDWVRGDRVSPQAAASRVTLFLDALQAQPDAQERLQQWWLALTGTVDPSTLLADFGFAPRTAFVSELAARLRGEGRRTSVYVCEDGGDPNDALMAEAG